MRQTLASILKNKESAPLSIGHLVALGIILSLSLFLRLAMVDMIEGTVPIRNDARDYYSYAVNMKYADVYSRNPPSRSAAIDQSLKPDANRPPGYALFLYPFVTLPPTMEMVHRIRVAQVILSTITVLLSFLVFRYFLSNEWSLLGSLLIGISPHLVSMNIYLLTETLFTFFLMLFVYLAILAYRSQNTAASIMAGLTLGCTLLIKPSMTYFLYLLILVFILQNRTAVRYKFLTLFCIGFLLAQAPWMLRNASMDIENSEKSKALVSLQNGSYPGLMYNGNPATAGIPHRADPDYDNIVSYGDFFQDLKVKALDEPGKYISWYVLGKLQMMFSWDMVAGAGDIFIYAVDYSPYSDRQPFVLTHSIMRTIHPAIMMLSLFGMVLVIVTNRITDTTNAKSICLLICSTLMLYYVALHILVTPLPRYMIPLRPILYGLALYFIVHVAGRAIARYGSKE